jgi:hypothetical protein
LVGPAAGLADIHTRPTIPAEDAPSAVDEFERQTGIDVVYDSDALAHVRTNAVKGDLEALAAIQAMFDGKPVKVDSANQRTIVITPLELVRVSGIREHRPWLRDFWARRELDVDSNGHYRIADTLLGAVGFEGGSCDDNVDSGSRDSRTNSARGCGANARGYGPSKTVVLFDGMRTSYGGTEGRFADVEQFPRGAIVSEEHNLDGPALRYGLDAIGGTVNFIPRMDFKGSELQGAFGPALGGAVGQQLLLFRRGIAWGAVQGAFSVEYGERHALPAAKRSLATNNLAPWGGRNWETPYGWPGTIVSGSMTWAVPPHPFQAGDLVAGTVNLHDSFVGTDILPDQKHLSAFLGEHWVISEGVELRSEWYLTHRIVRARMPALGMTLPVTDKNAFCHALGGCICPMTEEYGFLTDLGPTTLKNSVLDGMGVTRLTGNLFGGWHGSAAMSYSLEHQDEVVGGLVDSQALSAALVDSDEKTAFDPFEHRTSANTLRNIRTQSRFRSTSDLKELTVSAQGPIGHWRVGDPNADVGLEYRGESLRSIEDVGGVQLRTRSAVGRGVLGAYGEVCLPLLGKESHECTDPNAITGSQLKLTAGARYEHYTDVHGVVAPAMSLYWTPGELFSLTLTRAESIKVPAMMDRNESENASALVAFPGPVSGEWIPTLALTGKNAGLHPETARTWTATLSLRPPGRIFDVIDAHWFYTDYRDRIDEVPFRQDVLVSPDLRSLVTFNPTADQIAQVCTHTHYAGSPPDCPALRPAAIADFRLHNAEREHVSGVDVWTERSFQGHFGSVQLRAQGTYYLEYRQNGPDGRQSLLDKPGDPLRLRLGSTANWRRGDTEAALTVHYVSGYTDRSAQPFRNVGSWTTLDLRAAKEFPGPSGTSSNVRLVVSVENICNVTTPFVDNPSGSGLDTVNYGVNGRAITVLAAKRW